MAWQRFVINSLRNNPIQALRLFSQTKENFCKDIGL
jgi:hypothetical protein